METSACTSVAASMSFVVVELPALSDPERWGLDADY